MKLNPSYQVPVYHLPGNSVDLMHNDRGPMADRDPYIWRNFEAVIGYKVQTRNPYKYTFVGDNVRQIVRKANTKRRLRIGSQIGGVLLLIAAIILMVVMICGVTVPAKADSYETDIGFPSFWEHDAKLVESVQLAINNYLDEDEKVEVDGKFGKATGQAVKLLQKRYGMTVTGVVDDDFAYSFYVQNWPYGQGYTLYFMANLQLIYNHSDYEDLIYISLGGRGYNPNNAENTGSHLWLFRDGKLIADAPCITGNEQKGYFTPLGKRTIKGRHEEATGKYSRYYWLLHLNEKIFIHSTLDYFDPNRDKQVLGAHQSDGSIRVPTDFAEWLYKNEPNGITVVIDDRAFSPYGAPGYEHLLEDDGYADWEEEKEPDYTRYRRRYDYDYDYGDEAVG